MTGWTELVVLVVDELVGVVLVVEEAMTAIGVVEVVDVVDVVWEVVFDVVVPMIN